MYEADTSELLENCEEMLVGTNNSCGMWLKVNIMGTSFLSSGRNVSSKRHPYSFA